MRRKQDVGAGLECMMVLRENSDQLRSDARPVTVVCETVPDVKAEFPSVNGF